MAKNASNGNSAPAFVLAFLGSLAYLYVVYGLVTNWHTPALFAGVGAVFLPIFAGVGILSAIGLFLASFSLLKGDKKSKEWIWKSTLWGGVALVALTVGDVASVGIILLGFILATIGSMVAAM